MNILLQDLRARIAQMEGFSPPETARVCSTGWAAIDAALPGNGLLQGAVHEIHSPDPADGAATSFALRLLGRFQATMPDRAALWASCRTDLFAPGLLASADPSRIVMAKCITYDETLFVIEEGIKSNSLSVCFGDIGELEFSISRRLQLACAETSSTLVLLRPARFGAEPSAAVTRWRAESCPGGWSLTLFRCRGGRPGHWRMSRKVDQC